MEKVSKQDKVVLRQGWLEVSLTQTFNYQPIGLTKVIVSSNFQYSSRPGALLPVILKGLQAS